MPASAMNTTLHKSCEPHFLVGRHRHENAQMCLSVTKNKPFPKSKPITLPTFRNHKLAPKSFSFLFEPLLVSVELLRNRLAHVRAVFERVFDVYDNHPQPFQRRIPRATARFGSRRSPNFESVGFGEAVGAVVRAWVAVPVVRLVL
jgi:hypothetical protein